MAETASSSNQSFKGLASIFNKKNKLVNPCSRIPKSALIEEVKGNLSLEREHFSNMVATSGKLEFPKWPLSNHRYWRSLLEQICIFIFPGFSMAASFFRPNSCSSLEIPLSFPFSSILASAM